MLRLDLRAPVLLVLFGLAAAGAASAGPLAPARASDLVTVITKDQTPCSGAGVRFDTRLLPDGSQQPFAIPPKHVLVVTSADFLLTASAPAGVAAAPVLSLQNGGAITPILQGSGMTDAAGNAVGHMLAPNGVVVRSGPELCLVGGDTQSGFVHGFFAKDK